MTRGLATLLVAYHNRERFLADAIRSILAQRYARLQLILIDDGSSDQSFSVARSFRDPRILHLRLHRCLGKSAALNRGLPHVEGEWWSILDSDDRMTALSIQGRVEFLRRHPEKLAVMGRVSRMVDSQGGTLDSRHPYVRYWKTTLGVMRRMNRVLGGLIPELFVYGACPVSPMAATLFRRSLLKRVGRLNERFPVCEDAEYLSRLSRIQPIPFLDKPVLWYRVHNCNLSFRVSRGRIRSNPLYRPMFRKLQEHHLELLRNGGRLS